MNIRKAAPNDTYDFAKCHISCFHSAYKDIIPNDYLQKLLTETELLANRYNESLINPGDCNYYCVMNEDKMVGFLITHNSGEIWSIYLIKEFCGKGHGKKILDYAITELKGIEVKEIYLWVFEANKRARRFYEKNNMIFDGTQREMKYGKSLIQLRYVLKTIV